MHGGNSPGAPKGKANDNYRHGHYTFEAVAERRHLAELVRAIRDTVIVARKTRKRSVRVIVPLHVRSLPSVPKSASASLIETRRDGGKVRHEHIASFGAVDVPPSIRQRLAFWARLPERLAMVMPWPRFTRPSMLGSRW
jgi:hypothetical protein